MARNDGTIEREQEQLTEARLRDEIGRLRGMLERALQARRDEHQEVVRLEAREKELDDLATRQFKEIKTLRASLEEETHQRCETELTLGRETDARREAQYQAERMARINGNLRAENATLCAKTSVVEDGNG